MRTITVESFFGEKQVSKADYISQWTSHTAELNRISYTPEWREIVANFQNIVEVKAAAKFELAYSNEHGE